MQVTFLMRNELTFFMLKLFPGSNKYAYQICLFIKDRQTNLIINIDFINELASKVMAK